MGLSPAKPEDAIEEAKEWTDRWSLYAGPAKAWKEEKDKIGDRSPARAGAWQQAARMIAAHLSKDHRVSEDQLEKIAVRIKEGNAATHGEVLAQEIEDHRGLAGTRLPDDMQVSAAIILGDAEMPIGGCGADVAVAVEIEGHGSERAPMSSVRLLPDGRAAHCS